jgi:hypothetical protein
LPFLSPNSIRYKNLKQENLNTTIKMLQSVFLQLFLAAIAFAAPVAIESNAIGYGTGGGIVGLIVLVLDVLVFSKPLSPCLSPLVPTPAFFYLSGYESSHHANHSIYTRQDLPLTLLSHYSRGPQIEPPCRPQVIVVLGRLPLPDYRNDYLLPVLEPRGA